MKRLSLLAVLLMMIFCCAGFAEPDFSGLSAFDQINSALAELTEAEWEEKVPGLSAFEVEKGLTVGVCIIGEQAAVVTVEFTREITPEKLDSVLEAFPFADAALLEQLEAMEENGEVTAEGCVAGVLQGETRRAYWFCPESVREGILWLPMHGGDQVHDLPTCSGMDVAWPVTPEIAAESRYDDCDTCRADRESA